MDAMGWTLEEIRRNKECLQLSSKNDDDFEIKKILEALQNKVSSISLLSRSNRI